MPPIKNNLQRANAARIFFYLLVGISILSLYSNYLQLQLLNNVKNGISVTPEMATSNDARQLIISVLNVLLLLLSSILFLVWMYRAYDNLYKLRGDQLSTTPGWAVGYWFVPVVSLFKPYQVMKEIWEETESYVLPETEKWNLSNSSLVAFWWTLYLLSIFSSYFVSFAFADKKSIDGLITLTNALMCANVFEIIVKVVTLVMINKTVLFEKRLFEFVNDQANQPPAEVVIENGVSS